MLLENRINAFVELGKLFSQFSRETIEKKSSILNNDLYFDALHMQIKRAQEFNGWFTKDNVLFSFENWRKELSLSNLTTWTSSYKLDNESPKKVAVIMAGNIPLVGFHDFLAVLLAGHHAVIKQSSNDQHFMPLIAKFLGQYDMFFKENITFLEGKLTGFDAAIATGSNNTSRYFDYYFGDYPNIIRNNRNSVGVINGNETQEELTDLGEDIFSYFGLGCRSVSKIFVPKNYDFDLLFKAIYDFRYVIEYKKYENNYDYNKAVFLMSNYKLLENGFLMLKEDPSYASPIACLFYEYYEDLPSLEKKLLDETDQIQCIVSNTLKGAVKFGQTQRPQLTDYADGVDTLKFLEGLS